MEIMDAQSFRNDGAQRALLEDSARWRLIGLLFECPDDRWREALASLAALVPDPDLREAAGAAPAEASETLYHSIFGPGGPASPREVSYHKSTELGGLMSELTRYYEAFGYSPATDNTCDHVAVEAGFIGYLRLKEAYARACLDEDRAATAADASCHFLADHVSTIARQLCARLEGSGIRYLALAGRALIESAERNVRAV